MENLESKVIEHLERVGDPFKDHIWHRDNLLRLGALAALGVGSAIGALAVAGHFGYDKWRHNQDQNQRLMTILIANQALLSQGREEGRQAFIENLYCILQGDDLLDPPKKIRFLKALTDEAKPIDIYFGKGGLGVWKYNQDGLIVTTLENIRQEIVSQELNGIFVKTIRTIQTRTEQMSRA